jgi:shikimate kinase
MIVAPGGGWVSSPEVVAIVRPPSRLVYLRVRPDTALKRLGPMRMMRPLLTRPDPLGELTKILEARKAAYESADSTIDTELYGLQRVIEKVVALASGKA